MVEAELDLRSGSIALLEDLNKNFLTTYYILKT